MTATTTIDEVEQYNGDKWEYLLVPGDASAGVTIEELNKWGSQGWELSMAYIQSTPVAVLPSIVQLAPGEVAARLTRVCVYRRKLKEVKP